MAQTNYYDQITVEGNLEIAEMIAYIKQGKKIQAIKVLREQTALGLKEAKDIVDLIDKNMHLPMQIIVSDNAYGTKDVRIESSNEKVKFSTSVSSFSYSSDEPATPKQFAADETTSNSKMIAIVFLVIGVAIGFVIAYLKF